MTQGIPPNSDATQTADGTSRSGFLTGTRWGPVGLGRLLHPLGAGPGNLALDLANARCASGGDRR